MPDRVSGPAVPDQTALRAFWQAAKAASPAIRGDRYRIRAFGNRPDIMGRIIDQIVTGEKRGTFLLPPMQAADPNLRAAVGDYFIVVDFDGKPAVLATTTALEPVTFGTLTAAHTAIEGPGLRDVEVWKNSHRPYFTTELAKVGATFAEDMPVIVEYFKAVYPARDPDAARVRGLDTLPAGATPPSEAALDSFWRAVKIARPDIALPASFEARCIGNSADAAEKFLEQISAGTKVGTFRLAAILNARGQPSGKTGDVIVLSDWTGAPRLALRLTATEQVAFDRIDARHMEIEGPMLRQLDTWKRVHRDFWGKELARVGGSFAEDLPVNIECFEVLYPAPLDTPVPAALQS